MDDGTDAFGKLGRWILDCAAGRRSSRRLARGLAKAWRARWPLRAPTWSCSPATRRRSRPRPATCRGCRGRRKGRRRGGRRHAHGGPGARRQDHRRHLRRRRRPLQQRRRPKARHVRHPHRRRLARSIRAQPDVGHQADAPVPALHARQGTGAASLPARRRRSNNRCRRSCCPMPCAARRPPGPRRCPTRSPPTASPSIPWRPAASRRSASCRSTRISLERTGRSRQEVERD